MTLSIRTRLTIWYTALVAGILVFLGVGVLLSASWGLRKAADEELTSGIDGVVAFLRHKLDIHQMNNLNDELREHSALLPRGKMFRVSNLDGSIVYQPNAMAAVTPIIPPGKELRKESIVSNGRSYRTISRFAIVGPYTFLIQVAVDQTEYLHLTTGLAWILILSVPLAGLLAAFTGYWMSGRALHPIHQITETANSIGVRSLSRRLPLLGTDDELDQLSVTINRMLDRIATSYERIAQFTADASHELRTPVTLIRSNAELLLMGPGNSPRVERGLSDILAESTYMTRLIGDLLTLARGADEDASIPMELLELNEPVRSILERAQAHAATRNISLEYVLRDQIVPLRGNQNMIERILMILIDNAVRYTPPGGKIWVETWVTLEHCGFIVRDTGIGIATSHHERIFERFFRVDEARTRRDGGYGLGLSIAKSLIEFHGGTVHLESEIGRGASFRVSLLRADVPNSITESQSVL
ncbi:MAG TPA: ATP-binding protein [Acidobacteriaceae bacterium]